MLKLFYTLDAIHEIKMLYISWHCPFKPSQVLCNCPLHCTVYILLFQRAVWPDVGPAAQAGGWQGCGGGRVSLAGPPRHPQPWPQGWYPQVWRSARPWPRRPPRGPLCHWGRCVCEHRSFIWQFYWGYYLSKAKLYIGRGYLSSFYSNDTDYWEPHYWERRICFYTGARKSYQVYR